MRSVFAGERSAAGTRSATGVFSAAFCQCVEHFGRRGLRYILCRSRHEPDHRLAHDAEERRRFARSIAEVAAHLVSEQALNPVIVIATHAVHSVLMGELSQVLPKHVYVRSELGELSEHSPAQLLHDLTERGLFRP
jgi:hypothetical protein